MEKKHLVYLIELKLGGNYNEKLYNYSKWKCL